MKVGLFAFKGNFSDYKEAGPNFYRYVYQLYSNMKNNKKGIEIIKEETSPSPVSPGYSFFFDNLFKDMSGFDIIHNLDFKPFYPLNKGKAIKINTAHDFHPILHPEYSDDLGRDPKGKVWLESVLKFGIRLTLSSDYLICISTLTRDDAAKLGYDKKKMFVVNHGVDERFFSKIPKKSEKFTVGYIGALRMLKNISFAINAMSKIDDKNIKFDIWAKKVHQYEMLKELAGNDRRISFNGYAPEDKFVKIYDSFNAFVFPTYYEGFGIPILEAQARGLPVIVYKKGKVPNEVKKYCFEAEDPEDMAGIIQKLKDNGYNDKQRKRSMEYARNFTWQKTANETLDVYKKIAR